MTGAKSEGRPFAVEDYLVNMFRSNIVLSVGLVIELLDSKMCLCRILELFSLTQIILLLDS